MRGFADFSELASTANGKTARQTDKSCDLSVNLELQSFHDTSHGEAMVNARKQSDSSSVMRVASLPIGRHEIILRARVGLCTIATLACHVHPLAH